MTLEEYLEHTEECERLAALANLRSIRLALQASAEMWRKLAADATKGNGVALASGVMRSRPPE